MPPTFKWIFLAVAACPLIFLFAMMQMSQITVPFWDHWDTGYFISKYYEEGAWVAFMHSLTFVHNHTRPVILRAIFVPNAILTRWNVGSEYIYLYAAMAVTLFTHYRIVRKLNGDRPIEVPGALLLSLIFLIYCSPANHNNHWWSFMLQLVMSNAFTLLAISIVAFNPREWKANCWSALLCWLSIFTLTNGLFAMVVSAVIVQLASDRPLRPNKLTAFWIANGMLIYLVYFPLHGAPAVHPSVIDLTLFVLTYIGEPIAALIRFPYQNMFEPPLDTRLASVCGAILLAIAALIAFVYRSFWRMPSAHFLIFIGFGLYALLSAAGTGWGRITFDEYGVRNGGSSRYVITGSYVIFALMYFAFAERETILSRLSFGVSDRLGAPLRRSGLAIVYLAFLAVSANAYAQSIPIYKQARDLNIKIAAGFLPDASDSAVDSSLYPNQERLRLLRGQLLRYRIGPYRGDPPK